MKWAATMTAVLGVLALGGLAAALLGPKKLNLPAPLASEGPAPEPPVTPPRRVLMVVVDGLRADTARALPSLQALARRGASFDLWADPPTFSASQYVALLTGVPPRDSGVRDNAGMRLVALDNLPARVRAQGRSAVHLSDDVDWWERLFGRDFDRAELAPPPTFFERSVAATASADLAVLHLCGVDSAGHNHGAASPEYRAAALEADRQVARLVAAWEGPVAVVADHGHVDRGGHGGEEDEVRRTWAVLAGPGVQQGVALPDASALDLAPTLAALLGVAAPGSAQGRTLVSALALAPAARAALEEADGQRLARVAAGLARARRAVRRRDLGWAALRAGMVAALCALAFAARRRFPRALRTGLWAGLACAAGTWALGACLWGRASLSDSSQLGWDSARGAALCFALAVVLLGWARARVLREGGAGEEVPLAFGFALGAAPFAAGSFVAFGAFSARLVCEPAWLAALPMVAYACFAPAALLAVCTALPACLRVVSGEVRSYIPELEGATDA